jgi:hypothetical protein
MKSKSETPMQGWPLRSVMRGNSLVQPHSAVNQQNYSNVGSHTIGDAARNAQQNENHNQRMQRVRNNQNINHNALMQPAQANGSQLPPSLGITRASGGEAVLWGAVAGGVGGLFCSPKTKKGRAKVMKALGTLGILLTGAGTVFGDGLGSDHMWRPVLGTFGAVAGLVIANNLRRFGEEAVRAPKRPLRLSELPY